MEVLCDDCPVGGVGIYNPGFWGMVRVFVDHKLIAHSIILLILFKFFLMKLIFLAENYREGPGSKTLLKR
jgi:hypothetical protein